MRDTGMHDSGTLDMTTNTVRFERTLPGPILRVWSYLTDGDRLCT